MKHLILTGLAVTLLTLSGLALLPGQAGAQAGAQTGAQAGTQAGSSPAVPATAPVPAAGQEVLTRLKNGLTVYIIRDTRFPLVCTRLYVGTGSANESAKQAGISHVLEHMVFKGTAQRPKGRIARDVEELGGYLNAATSFDMTYYLTDMPSRHWRTGMDVVKDMAFHATLDPAELESEKDVIVSELQGNEDTPPSRLFQALQVSGLHNSVYGRPIIGFEETIRALTVQDLRDYIATWYQPQNMLLLVAGDIDPAQVLAHAQSLFGDLENTADLPMPPDVNVAQAAGGPQVEVLRGPWNKVYMGLALPVPGLRDVRSVDLDVLAFLLGGDGTSTLYRKYQYDQRLVDSISMGNMSLQRAGLLVLNATLDVKHVETFWDSLTRDLAALNARDFSDEAIARAIFNLTDSMDRAGETLNGLASWRGTVQFELGGRDAERNLRQAQMTVDKARLAEAIAGHAGHSGPQLAGPGRNGRQCDSGRRQQSAHGNHTAGAGASAQAATGQHGALCGHDLSAGGWQCPADAGTAGACRTDGPHPHRRIWQHGCPAGGAVVFGTGGQSFGVGRASDLFGKHYRAGPLYPGLFPSAGQHAAHAAFQPEGHGTAGAEHAGRAGAPSGQSAGPAVLAGAAVPVPGALLRL